MKLVDRITEFLNESLTHVVFATDQPHEIAYVYLKKYGKEAISHLENVVKMFMMAATKSVDKRAQAINLRKKQNAEAALKYILSKIGRG